MPPPTVLFVVSGLTAVLASGIAAEAGDPVFQEIAVELGIGVPHSTSGFAHSTYTGGGAVGDFNNDGYQDLFVISGGSGNRPDRLFINNRDGTFTERAEAWGLATPHRGKGVSVGDYNGDGRLDLYVTSAGPVGNSQPGRHKLYRNNGDNSFTDVAGLAGVNVTAASQEDGFGSSFGDYDLDGDLDLFVAGFAPANAGNRIFRNDGDGTFTDVTDEIGFFDGTPISLASFAPRFADMDGDFYPELLLASDFGTSRYFRNNRDGTFTDATDSAGTGLDENGMGQAIGDFNGDGLLDWYVTSIFLPSAGWTGNKLYINTGNHSFSEQSVALGVFDGGYGWAAVSVDFNHDTRLDIAETNGDSSAGSPFANEQSYLWIQNPDGTFTEMATASGFAHFGRGRGMVNFDYDNDGDQDVVIFANNERPYFFRNDLSGPNTNWLRVFLDTGDAPGLAPNGSGARVQVTVGGETQHRYISSGDNFLSHSELSAHFGLGPATIVDELRVLWPDLTSTILADVAVNQTLVIAPGGVVAIPGDIDNDGTVGIVDFLALLADWGPCSRPCPPSCAADVDDDCTVGILDLLILLANWT